MAGFDVIFEFRSPDEPLVQAWMAAARRRAKQLGIWRFRSEISTDSSTCYLALDGQTYGLDIYLDRLRRDLPTIGEATPCARTPGHRRRLAMGLIDILTRARLGMYDRYGEGWRPTLRARSEPAYLRPHELYADKAPRLQARLDVTMGLMADWHFGEVAPETLLEELHAAVELILESTVNRRSKRLSFAQLVEKAYEDGVLNPLARYPEMQRLHESSEYWSEYRDKARELLLALKDTRKNVRHRGADGARAWLNENFWGMAEVLESLAPLALDPDEAPDNAPPSITSVRRLS
ncbi:hypothetical protein [Lentzea atacamensis]|nr:hypothetical protein [Lentzea atacamensis]